MNIFNESEKKMTIRDTNGVWTKVECDSHFRLKTTVQTMLRLLKHSDC